MASRTESAFALRHLDDGRAMINLGSSARVARGWNNLDFSWLVRLSRYPALCNYLHRAGLLNAARLHRIHKVAEAGIVFWDLRKGIPYADCTFDCVYHSHLLEHIDRHCAVDFLAECRRVLKPGGVVRVVVPDLETISRNYLQALESVGQKVTPQQYASAVEDIFDQMIVRTPAHRRRQPAIVRGVENLLIGDTRRNGELHRWMYDRYSLADILKQAGFRETQLRGPITSSIHDWADFHLDTEPDGTPYKQVSLYMEAQ